MASLITAPLGDPTQEEMHPMTSEPFTPAAHGPPLDDEAYAGLQKSAREHLWMHFTRMSSYDHGAVPILVKGDGAYIWDAKGRKYLDALAGLFVSQVGHGRTELAEAAAKQASQLAFFPLWSYAHPQAIELAARLAHMAPGD